MNGKEWILQGRHENFHIELTKFTGKHLRCSFIRPRMILIQVVL
jgi:hypothetical protein